MNKTNTSGFTLIEVAIVLLIVTILLGYSLALFPVQQELKQYRQANHEMDKIIESIYAFAQSNNYLPCPSNAASSGFECRNNNGTSGDCDGTSTTIHECDLWAGFVPGKTLGLNGKYNAAGLLLDPWGKPYRYQVTDTGAGTGSIGEDFVLFDGMRDVGIPALTPDISVCTADPSPTALGSDTVCASAALRLINNAPAVILSQGKDALENVATTSWIQRENLDNGPGDRVFISTSFSDRNNVEFDDLVKWISPNILYGKMIDAGHLP